MDQGVARMAAAGILGVSGLTSIFGRVGTGIVADRLGAKRTLLSALSLQAALIFLYLFATSEGALWGLSLAFGVAYGGAMPLYAVVTREYFGERILGTAYGGVFFISCIGMGLVRRRGPPRPAGDLPVAVPGLVHDRDDGDCSGRDTEGPGGGPGAAAEPRDGGLNGRFPLTGVGVPCKNLPPFSKRAHHPITLSVMAFTRFRPRSRGAHPVKEARAIEARRNATTRPTVHLITVDNADFHHQA